ncbi:hypothetical protein [Autumnicola musiva]|uniref:Uncharacterized protein n=1 Tax=Autumnicola musiva TaxID=3075589 RepID=A0ABU3DAD5_9FLAO|nr:hypothetical protein [Zunongwangia sp. F117]MDT0678497.1 hypothetical protein [Zunongwangia sp. F117]
MGGDTQILWPASAEDKVLELSFEYDKKEKRRTMAQLTKAKDYGKFSITVNGGTPVTWNGYSPNLVTEKLYLGEIQLLKGVNTIEIKFMKNVPGLLRENFGIDYLEFQD